MRHFPDIGFPSMTAAWKTSILHSSRTHCRPWTRAANNLTTWLRPMSPGPDTCEARDKEKTRSSSRSRRGIVEYSVGFRGDATCSGNPLCFDSAFPCFPAR